MTATVNRAPLRYTRYSPDQIDYLKKKKHLHTDRQTDSRTTGQTEIAVSTRLLM